MRAVGFGGIFVEIVDQDEIEIGARGHLPAAELPHGQDRALLTAQAAVGCRERVLDRGMQRLDQHVCKPRKRLARLLGRDRA